VSILDDEVAVLSTNLIHSYSLCNLGSARLCPSYRKVDPKSVASRVKVELLPDLDAEDETKIAVKLEGPEGPGSLLVKEEDVNSSTLNVLKTATIKTEDEQLDW
jgi:hypothetical protein